MLQANNIVVLNNGKVGIVDTIFGTPCLVVFSSFTMQVKVFDEKYNHKKEEYSIAAVYDGSSVTSVKEVYSRKFNPKELPLLWERAQ